MEATTSLQHCIHANDAPATQLLLQPFTSRCPKSLRPPQVAYPRPAASAVGPEAPTEVSQAAGIDVGVDADQRLAPSPPALLGLPPISPQRPRKRFQDAEPPLERFGFRFTAEALTQVEKLRKNASPFHPRFNAPILPPQPPQHAGKITLVLDVDETLVHASFHPRTGVEYNLALDLQAGGVSGTVFVAYRPDLRTFLRSVAEVFEVVAFTASRAVYANMLLDALDPEGTLFSARLFREHCTEVSGAKVKDLALLLRPLDRIVMVDNSPIGYLFQPRNGVPITSWFNDPHDTALLDLLPGLLKVAACDSVYPVLDALNAQYLTTNNSGNCRNP